ncbi:glyoxylase-like metal-dependent hydrolase (beta-lactamase superfamily II) [Alkalibacillus filiformis]|uniref:Glyoxylase-like metal-dependent hydrolase (Beta-lactamase superfamily II) n=1 Tax=Alkalibacillus filiformis TaxID=200990 RepID=A0ABU0DSV6_9BACI|nr:MBL fold metallo-hydrolase [Alkalibacillus filiformis]MDQ0351429.1 glyoxylase-like metal-dependent hydrolase (beta-lactamase superfamily II) [Alkalibacillus filiformis]
MSKPIDLNNGISLIDIYDLGLPKRTGSYVIHDEELTVVETSASPSVPYLLEGLKQLGLKPEDIRHIIVTHIHLDHAGGVGLFLESCPNATVHVHPRGKRHLADPSKLIQGARAVYGEKFDKLFDPIVPVPEERLQEHEDGSQLTLKDRELTFYDSPGHAKHHFSIHESKSNSIFTGDTIGVYYPDLLEFDEELVLPSTSPNQFDPEAMLDSLSRIERLEVDAINFGHFGQSTTPELVYKQMREWLPRFLEVSEAALVEQKSADLEEQTEAVKSALFKLVSDHLDQLGVPHEHKVYQFINMDVDVCALGIVDYIAKVKS